MSESIKLSQFLAVSDLAESFLWLKKTDNFMASIQDITDLSVYYDYIITNIDFSSREGAGILVVSIMEPETVNTYFHPDNSRFNDDLR